MQQQQKDNASTDEWLPTLQPISSKNKSERKAREVVQAAEELIGI